MRDESDHHKPAVVHVAPDPFGRGGMAAVVRGLLTSELADRYALSSITTHRPGSTLKRIAVALRGGLQLSVWCIRHPDGLVHVHAAVRGSLYRKGLVILLARSFRRPVLLHVHAGPGDIHGFANSLGPVRYYLLAWALRRADAVVSVSAASSEAFASAFALSQVGVILNAAPDPPADVAEPAASDALFLGGFEDPAKGGAELVEVIPAILRAAPTLTITLAGPGEPPRALHKIEGPRVRWRGWFDAEAKHAALSESGIVLMPSRSEGLPVVLLEAMAYGRAVVATRVGGIPDLITDELNGLLVDPADGAALVHAVSRLAGDGARVRAIGAAARERVVGLGQREVVERIDVTYRTLLGR